MLTRVVTGYGHRRGLADTVIITKYQIVMCYIEKGLQVLAKAPQAVHDAASLAPDWIPTDYYLIRKSIIPNWSRYHVK